MKACFIAETPYHVLNCVRIADSIDMKKDLYLVNLFENSESLVMKIKELDLFDNVYYIKDLPLHGFVKSHFYDYPRMYILVLFHYIFMNKYIKRKAPHLLEYTHFYNCHRLDFFPRVAGLYIMKYLPNANLYFYDDGIGSYNCGTELYEPGTIGKLFDTIFSHGNSRNSRYTLKLNAPDFIYNSENLSPYIKKIEPIAPIIKNSFYEKLLSQLYGTKSENKIDQRFIFLDDVRNEVFNQAGLIIFNNLTKVINESIGLENIIYKKHPRDKYFDNTLPHIQEQGVPFEWYSFSNNISQKVLISYFSTAAFTPKMLYDEEPYLIFLCGLMSGYESHKSNNIKIAEHFKETYNDKERIFIPKSNDELIECIQICKQSY